jgi:hypothetical protein
LGFFGVARHGGLKGVGGFWRRAWYSLVVVVVVLLGCFGWLARLVFEVLYVKLEK